jgi:hypothetical protein
MLAMLGCCRLARVVASRLKRAPLGIGTELHRQYLDRDLAVEFRIEGAVNLSHTARADPVGDLVVGEYLPDQRRLQKKLRRLASSVEVRIRGQVSHFYMAGAAM